MNENILKKSLSFFKQKNIFQRIDHHPQHLRNLLLGLLLARALILTAIMGIHYISIIEIKLVNSAYISTFIIFTYIYSLISALIVSRANNLKLVSYIQIISDVILSTAAINLIGESGSVFLYFLTIIAANQILGVSGAIITAALSGITYALIAAGLFPYQNPESHVITPQEIFLVYISLIAVALSSSYHSRKIGRAVSYAKDREIALSDLIQKHANLFDTLNEGVIMLDSSDTISSVNEAAKKIIGLNEVENNNFIGKKLHHKLKEWGASNIKEIINGNNQEAREINFQFNKEVKARTFNYQLKPLKNIDGDISGKLFIFSDVSLLKNMEEKLSLQNKIKSIRLEDTTKNTIHELSSPEVKVIGESQIMKQIFKLVGRVSKSPASVLINGESGTGKEVIAKAIHFNSERSTKPFVSINCGAIPENLIESELFGHVKGAFTGAIKDNLGLFRQAQGGTLFLDEIGELPLHLQSKLLRALQEKKVRPVGGERLIDIDARVLSATNKDLKKEIKAKTFREDLYYRLNVINILLPSLKERKEDIPYLINYFIDKFNSNQSGNRKDTQMSAEALHILMSYTYPGNIRELENIVERALVLEKDCIRPEHLPKELLDFSSASLNTVSAEDNPHLENQLKFNPSSKHTEILVLPIDLEQKLANLEKSYLLKALDESDGVKKNAAEMLGLNFRSFRYRLKKYDLSE